MASGRRTRRQRVGQRCEDAALAFLTAHGLNLVCRNYASRAGEIDLIMLDKEILVFVEVRYRRHTHFGGAAASVDQAKQRRLSLTASAFLQQHQTHQQRRSRFDIMLYGASTETPDNWIKGAFRSA